MGGGRSEVRFGPAGIPAGTPGEGAAAGIAYCREIGLGAMEVEFVHGVNMGEAKARAAGEAARKNGIRLSCHAPYYINCCSQKKQIVESSISRIAASAQAASWLSASPVVVHTGHYMGQPAQECRRAAIGAYEECFAKMDALGIRGVALGAELTGKKTAYGSLDEIIGLAQHFGIERMVPVIDYAHFHAREGRLRSKGDFAAILERVENALGSRAAKSFHCHFSGIEFGDSGERRHLPISSNSPPFAPLAQSWKENGWAGTVICESPLLEVDALALQKIYENA